MAKFDSFKAIEVLIHSSEWFIRVVIVYRLHPKKKNNLTASSFFSDFFFLQLLEHLSVSSGKLLLLGDFNFHVDEPHADRQAARFLDLLDCPNLRQRITVPTHRSNHILDLLITRSDEEVLLDYRVDDPCLSDHYLVQRGLIFNKPLPVKIKKTYWKLRTAKVRLFAVILRTLSCSCLLHLLWKVFVTSTILSSLVWSRPTCH